MDFEHIIGWVSWFFRCYPLLAIGIIVVLVIFVYFKPKEMLKLLFLSIAVAVISYMLLSLGDSMSHGVDNKDKMITKTRRAVD
ncbi:MAG: hypothetical protein KKE17_08145 [Proteobacteria bacterium]|nr:hypothetical protein [Pseudomonadota bacterium]MBU1709957.1 hypothetical protein [Pseudomonadota bacterium]